MVDVKNDLQAVIDTALHSAEPKAIDSAGRLILIPDQTGRGHRIVDLAQYGAAPDRQRGEIVVYDVASFNQVVADHAFAGQPTIYIDRNPEKPLVMAVLNGSSSKGPGWGDLTVRIAFQPTPQWTKWKKIDGVLMSQIDFAEFIEENAEDIATPDGASMLEIAKTLEATNSVAFRSAIRLSDGNVQFSHTEDVNAKVGAGQIAVPDMITLGIAPLLGVPSYMVPARFRYRLRDGMLTMGVKLQRVETMMEQILSDITAKIERGTNISVLEGPMPRVALSDR